MFTIRKIETEEDFEKTRKLWLLHTRLMRGPAHERKDFDVGTIVGSFNDQNQLQATVRHITWQEHVSYSIDSLYVKPGEMMLYGFTRPNPVTPIVDFILAEREAEQYYTWFYVRAITKGYAKIQRNGSDLLLNTKLGPRYHRYVMDIVPAGERSRIDAHDAMMARRDYTKDVIVVQCNLDNDQRTWGNVLELEKRSVS